MRVLGWRLQKTKLRDGVNAPCPEVVRCVSSCAMYQSSDRRGAHSGAKENGVRQPKDAIPWGEHSPGQGHEKERKHAAGPPLKTWFWLRPTCFRALPYRHTTYLRNPRAQEKQIYYVGAIHYSAQTKNEHRQDPIFCAAYQAAVAAIRCATVAPRAAHTRPGCHSSRARRPGAMRRALGCAVAAAR